MPSPEPSIRIADRIVAPGRPVFIVAEAGVNHDGLIDDALRLVDAAADAGADAVKFQYFSAERLVTAEAGVAVYQRNGSDGDRQRAMLAALELSADAFLLIRARCEARNILFLATPFDELALRQLMEWNVPALKLASTDLTHAPLINAAIETGLPLILSTGAATQDEIDATVANLRTMAALNRTILLHCISCYPTPIEKLNLLTMTTLQARYSCPVGLSDHTISTDSGGWAVAAGAVLLEKHLTLDRDRRGPDHAASLTPDAFRQYVACARRAREAMGDGVIGMAPIEKDVRTVARRSIVAACNIPAGATITASMLTLKRPGTGIPAQGLSTVIGRQSRVAIAQDALLTEEMLG